MMAITNYDETAEATQATLERIQGASMVEVDELLEEGQDKARLPPTVHHLGVQRYWSTSRFLARKVLYN